MGLPFLGTRHSTASCVLCSTCRITENALENPFDAQMLSLPSKFEKVAFPTSSVFPFIAKPRNSEVKLKAVHLTCPNITLLSTKPDAADQRQLQNAEKLHRDR